MCAPHPHLARVSVHCPPPPTKDPRRARKPELSLGANSPLRLRTSSPSPAAAPPSPLRIVAHKELSVVMEISDCQTGGRGPPRGSWGGDEDRSGSKDGPLGPWPFTPIRGTTNLRGFMLFFFFPQFGAAEAFSGTLPSRQR